MSLTVNGLDVLTMVWSAGWNGPWTAHLELNSDIVPPGRVVITSTEGTVLVGTVDGKRSGTFADKRHARVVAGGGGWERSVRPQHFHSDVAVTLLEVASATAAEAKEVVTVLAPKVLGQDFVRMGEPASAAQIFELAGVDWWVGLDGVTKVGLRPPLPPHPDLQVLDWDPASTTVSFTSPAIVEPGTVLVDPRFGTKTVKAVEARFEEGSISGTLWVADARPDAGATNELVDTLSALAAASTRAAHGRLYEYRVIAMAGDRVELNAVRRGAGAPDILPASVWAGASGYRAVLQPASRVLVGFVEGDATRPYVAAYEPPENDGWRPVQLELDALASVTIGARAVLISLGGTGATSRPVVRATATFAAWMAGITAAVNTLAPGSAVLPIDHVSSKVTAS